MSTAPETKNPVSRMIRFRLFFLLLGLILFGIGLLRQETLLVLQRAIQICLGCIGIG
jgi:hypothetical protein